MESALVSHPKVAEAAVVGATDPVTGQAIVSFVILRGSAEEGAGHRHRAAQPRGQGARSHREAAPDPGRSRAAEDAVGEDHAAVAA
ncbi:AMP-binding enzyme [Nonomuraea dietziae]|uniref:AMP-binding enzyme n=1 Tax=Nonomuraea dietziae TaxID=65515 RepID=UPI003CD0975C